MNEPRGWVIVAGSGLQVQDPERDAAQRLGALLAREGYGLISGTWAGVDETVTRAFLATCPRELAKHRLRHVENGQPGRSFHRIRAAPVLQSSEEAIALATVGVVVGGRKGSKPTMDALSRRGRPVVPFAWLGSDALETFTEELEHLRRLGRPASYRKMFLQLTDPICAVDETVSRMLGAMCAARSDVFVSYHRTDTGADAGRLAASLVETYGARRVFVDYAALAPAARIQTVVHEAGRARAVVAFVGPKWVERTTSEQDYVRRELEAAIATRDPLIIPVLVDTPVPPRDTVVESLREVFDRIAVVVSREDWEATIARVSTAVDSALGITRMLPFH